MYSCGPLHMDEQRQDDQLEPTYSSSVSIWDVVLKTCRKQWTIEKDDEKASGISVLMARHDDDDDDDDDCHSEVAYTYSHLIQTICTQTCGFQ